jgi:hypothetical protein
MWWQADYYIDRLVLEAGYRILGQRANLGYNMASYIPASSTPCCRASSGPGRYYLGEVGAG